MHMRWADETVWKATLASPAAADDKRIRDLLAHLHMTQRAFLKVWRRENLERGDLSLDDLTRIIAWAREVHDEIEAFIATIDEDDLDRLTIMPWAARFAERSGLPGAADTTFRDTLLQLPMHSTYHRGQVNARLRELGAEPPLTDYIAWVWFGRPGVA